MNRTTATRLSWTLLGTCALLTMTGLLLPLTFHGVETDPVGVVTLGLALLAFPLVGALIVSRHPGHPIAWLFLAAGFGGALQAFFSGYGDYALAADRPLPGGVVASWLADVVWLPSIALSTTFLFLLFPDGRPLSAGWRRVAWVATVGTGVSALAAVFEPTLFAHPETSAPLAISMDAQFVIDILSSIGFGLWLGSTIAAVISMILRLRRARGEERQQMKWFAYAAAVALMILIPLFILESPGGFALFGGLALLSLPVSVGIAILKYRLYDIDVVINRTLVYGILTALLVAVYAVGTVGLGAAVRSLTGQENNAFVVAASTLAVAGLFGPARRRVQGFIDRRFYRHKYDAVRTLESFGSRLRSEVDLDALAADLVGVIRETMQPAYVSLWLRKTGLRRGRA